MVREYDHANYLMCSSAVSNVTLTGHPGNIRQYQERNCVHDNADGQICDGHHDYNIQGSAEAAIQPPGTASHQFKGSPLIMTANIEVILILKFLHTRIAPYNAEAVNIIACY